jgi:micrococcal nuclease
VYSPQPPDRRTSSNNNAVLAAAAVAGFVSHTIAFVIMIALLGVAAGPDATTASQPPASTAVASLTSSPAPTSTTAPPPEFVVTDILAGDSIVISDGTRTVPVTVSDIDAPDIATAQCWAGEAKKFASDTLIGHKIVLETGAIAAQAAIRIVLADGRDYATLAIAAGAVRAAVGSTATAIQQVQTAARLAGQGLWGEPCFGELTAPPPVQPLVPAPPAQEPPPAPDPQPAEPAPDVYYKNCDAVRAAGKAPLHRGEPGYRSALDRDGDGTACDT